MSLLNPGKAKTNVILWYHIIQSDTVYSLIPRDSYFIGNKYEMLYKSLIKKLFIIKSNLFLYCVPFYPR